jgi:hypothetical protein
MLRQMLITDTLIGFISPVMQLWFAQNITWHSVLAGQLFSHAIGTLAHLSLGWVFPRAVRWNAFARWTTVFLILAVVTAVGCAMAIGVLMLIGMVRWSHFWPNFLMSYRVGLIIALVFGIGGAVTETLKAQLEHATRQREKAMQIATEARLSSLESRVHPHFLFNALNSICALVREDPDRAERLIVRMAALLRFSLDSNQLGRRLPSRRKSKSCAAISRLKRLASGPASVLDRNPARSGSGQSAPTLYSDAGREQRKVRAAGLHHGNGNPKLGQRSKWRFGTADRVSISVRHRRATASICSNRVLQTIYGDAARLEVDEVLPSSLSVPCSAPISSTTKS